MRWVMLFIAAGLALTVLKAAIVVLLLMIALAILWGIFFRSAQTFGLLAFLVFTSLLQQHPVPVLVLVGVLGVIAYVRRPAGPSSAGAERPLLLLADHSKESPQPEKGSGSAADR